MGVFRKWIFVAAMSGAVAGSFVSGATVAFPGAEGYGRFATGGRGGSVYEVTNLNDSGPGSLRAAIDASGPRTIIFRVSGTIFLDTDLIVRNGDLTIAGQTAPGDGICIARRGFRISADNVIVRFIRARLGDLYARDNQLVSFESDAFECRYTDKVIVDHCSFSWSIDECATAYNNTNFTMQWCMVTESLRDSFHSKGAHGYGGIWGGANVTFSHNLLAHHTSRNPRFNGARYDEEETWDREVDHRNNIIYNWGGNSCYGGEPNAGGFQAHYNMVGNYYKYGPATSSSTRNRIIETTNLGGRVSKFFVDGNFVWGFEHTTNDNWDGVDKVPVGEESAVKAEEAFRMAPVTEQSASAAFEITLAWVGACYPKRDSVDARIVEETRSGTATYGNNGIIDSQEQVGGYPTLLSVEAPVDSDHDGMPDDWEMRNALDPNDADDGKIVGIGSSGYTNLERYLNSLVAGLYPVSKASLALGEDGALRLEWRNQLNDSEILESETASDWSIRSRVGSEGNEKIPASEVDTSLFIRIQPFESGDTLRP